MLATGKPWQRLFGGREGGASRGRLVLAMAPRQSGWVWLVQVQVPTRQLRSYMKYRGAHGLGRLTASLLQN